MLEYRKAILGDIEDLMKIRIEFLHDIKNIRNEEEEKILIASNRGFCLIHFLTEVS